MNILITGTSSGLGFGLAQFYLDKGENVYGISRKSNSELESYANFHFVAHDLTTFESTPSILTELLGGVEKLDIVLLNAGVLNTLKDVRDTSIEEFKKVMDINVWANKALIDALAVQIPRIEQIIGISSGSSQSGARGWNAYSISKTSLNMLLNLYAKELPHIHFCALAPGLVDTAMQDYLITVSETDKFPAVKKLQKAKREGTMPKINEAARTVANAIIKVRKLENGTYADVREL